MVSNTWMLPELKKLWNIKVTVIPIVVGALGMVPKETGGNWRPEESIPSKPQ